MNIPTLAGPRRPVVLKLTKDEAAFVAAHVPHMATRHTNALNLAANYDRDNLPLIHYEGQLLESFRQILTAAMDTAASPAAAELPAAAPTETAPAPAAAEDDIDTRQLTDEQDEVLRALFMAYRPAAWPASLTTRIVSEPATDNTWRDLARAFLRWFEDRNIRNLADLRAEIAGEVENRALKLAESYRRPLAI